MKQSVVPYPFQIVASWPADRFFRWQVYIYIYIYIYIYEKEYIYIHGLSNMFYYRILNIVPCAHLLGPCCFSALYIILWFVSADSKLLTLPPSLMAIYFLPSKVLKLFIVWCTNMFNTVWTQIVITGIFILFWFYFSWPLSIMFVPCFW